MTAAGVIAASQKLGAPPSVIGHAVTAGNTATLVLPSTAQGGVVRATNDLIVAIFETNAGTTPRSATSWQFVSLTGIPSPAWINGKSLGFRYVNDGQTNNIPADGTSQTTTMNAASYYSKAICIRGAALSNPIDVKTGGSKSGGTTSLAHSLTTTQDNELLFFEVSTDGFGITCTGDPAGMSGRLFSSNEQQKVWYGPQASAGPSGSKQASWSAAGGNQDSIMFSVKAA